MNKSKKRQLTKMSVETTSPRRRPRQRRNQLMRVPAVAETKYPAVSCSSRVAVKNMCFRARMEELRHGSQSQRTHPHLLEHTCLTLREGTTKQKSCPHSLARCHWYSAARHLLARRRLENAHLGSRSLGFGLTRPRRVSDRRFVVSRIELSNPAQRFLANFVPTFCIGS